MSVDLDEAATLRHEARQALARGDVQTARDLTEAAQRLCPTLAGVALEQVCACYEGFSRS
ncbi:MAG TPA: hypothetical protein VGO93_25455 [Candidatus Xenobia bacterium]|jgi:hypothetical protein